MEYKQLYHGGLKQGWNTNSIHYSLQFALVDTSLRGDLTCKILSESQNHMNEEWYSLVIGLKSQGLSFELIAYIVILTSSCKVPSQAKSNISYHHSLPTLTFQRTQSQKPKSEVCTHKNGP